LAHPHPNPPRLRGREGRGLAGEAGGCDDIAGAPDAGAAALAMRDQDRLAEARGDRRGGVADMDHERAAADRGAVDPFRREAQIVCHRHRGLAGGRDPVDVGTLRKRFYYQGSYFHAKFLVTWVRRFG
jgi:hypothetical protein